MGKYAVVIGVNYTKNPEAALEGCCNDARLMVNLLKSKGFEDEDIRILVDDDDDYPSPDHINVKKCLDWLCTGREPEDIIFMHFSGHGTQIPADDDDVEVDSLDEAICLEELFLMADDDLKQYFSQLPEGAHATVVMDCCHSGSMLDGTEVVIEGAKDGSSEAPQEESSSLLSILGGSREAESTNRSLPISTIAQIMSGKLGSDVPATGAGINGAMAKVFGGDAGKLMMKFAMSQLQKSDNPKSSMIMGMLGGMMGGSGKTSSGSSNPLGALMGESGSSGGGGFGGLMGMVGGLGGSNPEPKPSGGNMLGSMMGMLGGSKPESESSGGGALGGLMGMMGGSQPESQPSHNSSSQPSDPMSMLSGMLGDVGLPTSSSEAPAYNPSHQAISKDVCTLITGCQADETSADVRPAGGDAYGALTKTLTTLYEQNPDVSYYDLVSGVRSELSKGGFKQNPCLETSEEVSRLPFIC